MNPELLGALLLCILVVAALYSTVGHGGASGYIAAMALFSMSPAALKPTALVLNILVAAVGSFSFARAGHFSWRLFWPFALTSIPCSFIGGYVTLPPHLYRPLVGIILVASACRLLFHAEPDKEGIRPPPIPVALLAGGLLGLLSGLTGVGGGIFLSPLLLFLGWGRTKEVSAVAALFILVNSAAGLAGHVSGLHGVPGFAPVLAVAAVAGGVLGSWAGSRVLPVTGVVRALSAVLTIAGLKLLLV
ncbi:MAG TPA: sulfite exporter TauE/SafE family protein, partial [Verrucomicrobiae bacterium]|nr:sulfite exporter TauE/SafE family protein [Verrucomicrobiae bacterium]